MKLNPNKTQSMIVSRSETELPAHADLIIDNVILEKKNSFKILGILFDSKFTFEQHIRSMSSSVSQKIGLLRKSHRIFGDSAVLKKCFNSFILPCLEYCSPVWSSAVDTHLSLLEKNIRACKFLIPDLEVDLGHRRKVSSLCMLYKILRNPNHPLNSELPNRFQPARATRYALSLNSRAFVPVRYRTNQFSRCFIPATTETWNMLPNAIVESLDLQEFKVGVNSYLLRRITS